MSPKTAFILISVAISLSISHAYELRPMDDDEAVEPGSPVIHGAVESMERENGIRIEELPDDYVAGPGTPVSQGTVDEVGDLEEMIDDNPLAVSFPRPEVLEADVCLKSFEENLQKYVEPPQGLVEIRNNLYTELPTAKSVEEILFRPDSRQLLFAENTDLMYDCNNYLHSVEHLKQGFSCLANDGQTEVDDVTRLATYKVDYGFDLDRFLTIKQYHDIRVICMYTLFPTPQYQQTV